MQHVILIAVMLHLESPTDAKCWCTDQRSQGKTLGFVPTMGALHKGHLSLVTQARAENGICCASIFINPLQFEDHGDFDAYPRDKESDLALLEQGCDIFFMGSLREFFPEVSDLAKIDILRQGLMGRDLRKFRPGISTCPNDRGAALSHCRTVEYLFRRKGLSRLGRLTSRKMVITIVVCPTVPGKTRAWLCHPATSDWSG